jgi:hypothetical protein
MTNFEYWFEINIIWISYDLFAKFKKNNITKSHEALSCFVTTSW